MAATIKVTTAKLRSTAAAFNSDGNAIKKLTSEMTREVNQLSGKVWSGEAANAYKKKFNGLQDDINRMVKMINEHVSDLNAMAKVYENADTQAKSVANSLNDNVIQ